MDSIDRTVIVFVLHGLLLLVPVVLVIRDLRDASWTERVLNGLLMLFAFVGMGIPTLAGWSDEVAVWYRLILLVALFVAGIRLGLRQRRREDDRNQVIDDRTKH